MGDEIAEKKVSEIKRGFWYLVRTGIRKIINNRITKPKQMSFKKLNEKFANLERLDIQISKQQDLKEVKKIFNENKINFSINKGIEQNSYSIFYPPKDINKVENAMGSILDKQITINQKNKEKGKGKDLKLGDKKVPLKEQVERATKIVKERNQEIDLARELAKSKVKGKGDLEI